MTKIDENIVNQMNKDLDKFEKDKKRLTLIQKIEYRKYRKSLKPISKDEFRKRLTQIKNRVQKFIETCKKEDLFPMYDLGLDKIISNVDNAKDELDYAEIIDKLENILNDEETTFNTVMKHIKGYNNER